MLSFNSFQVKIQIEEVLSNTPRLRMTTNPAGQIGLKDVSNDQACVDNILN